MLRAESGWCLPYASPAAAVSTDCTLGSASADSMSVACQRPAGWLWKLPATLAITRLCPVSSVLNERCYTMQPGSLHGRTGTHSAKEKWKRDLSQLALVHLGLAGSLAGLPNMRGLGSETPSLLAGTLRIWETAPRNMADWRRKKGT